MPDEWKPSNTRKNCQKHGEIVLSLSEDKKNGLLMSYVRKTIAFSEQRQKKGMNLVEKHLLFQNEVLIFMIYFAVAKSRDVSSFFLASFF